MTSESYEIIMRTTILNTRREFMKQMVYS